MSRLVIGLVVTAVTLVGCGSDDRAVPAESAPASSALATTSTMSSTTSVEASSSVLPSSSSTATEAPPPAAPDTTVGSADSTLPDAPRSIEVSFSTTAEQLNPVVFADWSVGVQDQAIESTVVHADVIGDLEGTLTRSAITTGSSYLALEWFEGRIASCGTGAVGIRAGTRPDGATGWEIVPGLGVGDLVDVTGQGTMTGSRYRGTVRCRGAGDPLTFSSTILQPVPDEGTDGAVPMHVSLQRDEQELAVHPDQVMAPTFTAVNATYDVWLARGTMFWIHDDVPTVIRSENVGYDFLEDVCGHPGAARIILDDVFLPPFRGGWDLPPELNQGAYGSGRFDADGITDIGRVVCPD